MLEPQSVSRAILAQRTQTLRLLDTLDEAQLAMPALPRWSVADVFRHLADSDRGSVLGKHLLEFLPGKDLEGHFQEVNDANLDRLRLRGTNELRAELETWGRRLARIIGLVPATIGAIRIPTGFGKVPLVWMGGLRLYDEWVHRWDVAEALRLERPTMEPALASILGAWHLVALEADGLAKTEGQGIVELAFDDATAKAKYDLATHARVSGTDTREVAAHVVTDVASFSLLAADRLAVDDLFADAKVKVDGDEDAARRLLQIVRVV